MFTQNNTDPKRGDVRGDISSLIDDLVEYIDNADTTVICMLSKKQWILTSYKRINYNYIFYLDILNNTCIIK